MTTKTTVPDFEAALAELEQIVDRLEGGQQTLEEALASFQRGIELTRICQQGLKEAEQKVEQLIQDQGGASRIEPFLSDDTE